MIELMKPEPQDPKKSLGRLQKVWSNGVFSNRGPMIRELEARFGNYFGVDPENVVISANATVALSGALSTSPVPHWKLPSWTFSATAHAAVFAGKSLSFADVSRKDWMMVEDEAPFPSSGELIVLPFGVGLLRDLPVDREVVVDAAASFGELDSALTFLPETSTVVVSLHVTKVLGVGEGAVSVFGSLARASEFREWINFGFRGDRESRALGTNAKMGEYVAALIHTELDYWQREKARWLCARNLVDDASARLGLETQPFSEGTISPYWIAVTQNGKQKKELVRRLTLEGIPFRDWWGAGCHKMKAFSGIPSMPLPETHRLSEVTLGLPFHKSISQEQVARIAKVVSDSMKK